MAKFLASVLGLCAACACLASQAEESRCFGTVTRGRLEGGVQLPASGPNFAAASPASVAEGSTYVHATVAAIVLAAYEALAQETPQSRFLYGETGWAHGGPFRRHHSHQNGLSVDFFVPVRDLRGEPALLPVAGDSRRGYGLQFDARGRLGKYAIDFDAMAEHLVQLDAAARARGVGIAVVIFDPRLLARLLATRHGDYLRSNLPFTYGDSEVRHDEHYQVDFAVPCEPYRRARP